jgi:hypothetical protein
MKKNLLRFGALMMLISFGLSAQPAHITKGLRKIECEVVPIQAFSKSNLTNFSGSQISGPRMSPNTTKSLNWCGYASFTSTDNPEIGSVTGVWGTWNVPKLHPSLNDRYSACWVGIDGYSNQTVEQIGTAQYWQGGQQVNSVWFSLYPFSFYQLNFFPIAAHDTFRALVTHSIDGAFEMIIENLTQGVYFQIPVRFALAPGTQRNSAEWIVEAPSEEATVLPLAHFSPVHFRNCVAQIRGRGGRINSEHWKSEKILMVTGSPKSVVKADPSHLFNDGQNFIVKWHHQ